MKPDHPFKQGMQVAYIPQHAEKDINHEDVEYGFITKVDTERRVAWVRYWRGKDNLILRTDDNSQRTRFDSLVPHALCSRKTIDYMLHQLKYIDNAELALRKMGW